MDNVLDRWTVRPFVLLAVLLLFAMLLGSCGRAAPTGLLHQAEALADAATEAVAGTPARVAVRGGEILVVAASQSDVDVVLELRDAADRLLSTSAGPAGMRGRELLVWRAPDSVTERAGLALQVRARVVGADRPPSGRVRLLHATVPATAPAALRAALDAAAVAMAEPQAGGAAERARLFEQLERSWLALGERELAGEAALQLAALRYVDLEQWSEAGAAAGRAADALRGSGAAKEQADATLLRGIAASELSRARGKADVAALGTILEARRQYQSLQLPVAAAEALNYAGMAQFYQAEVATAVNSFAEAADEFRRAAANAPRRAVLQNLAVVQTDRGEYRAAAAAYEALLADWPEADGHARAAVLQNASIAVTYLGDYERALSWYLQSLDAARVISSVDLEARALQGLGNVHLLLGQPQLAIEHLREALRVLERLGDRMPQVHARNALGDALLAAGDREAALREQRAALRLLGDGGAREARGRVLVSLGATEAAFGRQQQAAVLFSAALSPELPMAAGVALRARYGRAQAWARLGRAPEARAELDALVSTAQAEFLPDHEALALGLRAQLRRDVGDRQGALSDSAAALAALDRLTVGTTNQDNRVTLARRTRELLELRVDLLADNGETLAALQALDLHGARSAWTSGVAFDAAPPDNALEEALAQRRYRLDALAERGEPDAQRFAALQAEIAVLRSRLAEQRRGAPASNVIPPQDLGKLQGVLPQDATVLVYALGRERGWLWQLSRDGVVLHRLPAADVIDTQVSRLLLRIGQLRDVEPELLRLRRILLPLDAAALAGRRLFVVPDGALAAVPWSLLKLPTGAAAVQQVARVSDLLRAPALRRTEVAAWRAALFGDPLFGPDPRGFAALPGTRRELEVVKARLAGAQVQVYTGAAASRAALLALNTADIDVLHLATHAYLDGYTPELSALVLSQRDAAGRQIPGDVRAADLLRWPRAPRLVVLSACDAASEPSRQAPGLLSLTRALHARGTEHVVASLWPVADAAAAALMDAFYAALVEDGLSPDRALTVAQRKLEQSPQWRAPFFWAGFVVIGAGP
jgi:tetratricopeptide (TPR) repeat protein